MYLYFETLDVEVRSEVAVLPGAIVLSNMGKLREKISACFVNTVGFYCIVLGGLTGLFLGASVVSVIEVLELIILQLKSLCCDRDENKVNNSRADVCKKSRGCENAEKEGKIQNRSRVQAFESPTPSRKRVNLFYV